MPPHDVPGMRAELLSELVALMPPEELSLLVPEDPSGIEELLSLLAGDTGDLLAELEAQAQRAEAAAPRMLTFAVEPEDESAVEEAIALVADGLGGRNRRGRALAVLCRRELERSGD